MNFKIKLFSHRGENARKIIKNKTYNFRKFTDKIYVDYVSNAV